jgi:Ca2+-binding RTX toxin-like protein
VLVLAAPAMAIDHLYGITDTSPPHLVSFESNTPGTFTSDQVMGGFVAGDTVVGMDTSPRDGVLYLITQNGATGRLYLLDETTAVALPIATLTADPADVTPPTYTSLGADIAFGVDFDPQSGLLRVVGANSGQNLRVNPANGLVTADTPISGTGSPAVAGVAYHNNDNDPLTDTVQYGYDFNNDDWGKVGIPSNGNWIKVADNNLFTSDNSQRVALDEAPSGQMWATHFDGGQQNLYEVTNIDTSGATQALVGSIPANLVGLSASVSNLFGVDATAITAGEGAGSARVTIVRLSARGNLGVSVDVTTTDGTATAGSDYTPFNGTVFWRTGQVTSTLEIPLLNDSDHEGNETFDVTLSVSPGDDTSLQSKKTTTVTIADDDPAPVVVEPPPPPPPTPDRDGDGKPDSSDNCPNVANVDQADGDGDGLGTVCDPVEPVPPLIGTCMNVRPGTPADDSLVGTIEGDVMTGLGGDDSLFGGAGADCLVGGPGDDWLSGGDGPDILRGDAGADVLRGGPGADDINGGKGPNLVIKGGDGDDKINSKNGKRETVDCGAGKDSVTADKRDKLKGCEKEKKR